MREILLKEIGGQMMKQRFTATVALMALLSSSTVPTLTQAAESATVLTSDEGTASQASVKTTTETTNTKAVQKSTSEQTNQSTKNSAEKTQTQTSQSTNNALEQTKTTAINTVNKLSNLTPEQKKDYIDQIDRAKSKTAVNTALNNAKTADTKAKQLAQSKEKAIQTVKGLKGLDSKQKNSYIDQIDRANSETAVNTALNNAKTANTKAEQASIEKPATKPEKTPSKKPVEKPASKPAEQPAAKPEKTPSKKPTTKPVKQPADNGGKSNNNGGTTNNNSTNTNNGRQTSTSDNKQEDRKNKTLKNTTPKYRKSNTRKSTTPRRSVTSSLAELDRQLGLTSDEEESSIKISPNMTGKEFIEAIADYAQEVAEENDLYASVMIAQACLETGFGTSGLSASPYYNFFGIKGSYKGKSVTMATLEDSSSGMYSINAAFRDYPSPKESLEDYADLLKTNFYRGAWKSNTDSYRDATRFLTGRYATDRNYYRKLNGIIEAYDLTQYDDATGKGKMKRVKKVSTVYYKVRFGDTINKLAKAHNNTAKQLKEWNDNKLVDINLIFPGQKLIVDKKVTYEYVKVKDDDKDNSQAKQGQFNLPLKKGSYTVTSPFGNRTAPNAAAGNYHEGIDLAVPMNSNVYATREGVVFASGYDPSAGNYIFIYHGNGIFSNYFHLSRATVKIGERVKAGEVIAKSGSTGNSTGPHLHFGISHKLWGDYENPEDYVKFK